MSRGFALNKGLLVRYLFLDIDGVIAGDAEWGAILEDNSCLFNKDAILWLNRVFDTIPDIQLIISSTWRKGETIESLQAIFKRRGFKYYYRIIDKTPVLQFERNKEIPYISVPRGSEIDAWLRANTSRVDQYKYCIIDDGSDMLYYQRDNFVHIHYTELFNEKYTNMVRNILE